jgi:hypothetical protein
MVAELLKSILSVPAIAMGTAVHSSSGQTDQVANVGFSIGSLLLWVLVLLVLVACVMTALKIYMAIRGGKIAQGWIWFVAGFGLLGLAQLVLIATQLGMLPVSQLWTDTLRAGAVIVLLIGAGRLRKLLT